MGADTFVLAENLIKTFGKLKAVDEVSFDIKKSEIYGLIGPDGAGKTTTLSMLAGILKPDSGFSEICGINPDKNHDAVKDKIAYMAQKFGLYPDLTVYENVRFYAELYGIPPKELDSTIDELLDFSYMRPFKNRQAGKLSGGMKQKLQLVCALIHKPDVLLLDEPTNGVDPVSRRDFWRILYQLAGEGVTIVVSTAYLDEAERCSRIALMDKGKIIAEGTPQEVIKGSGLKMLSIRSSEPKSISKILKRAFSGVPTHVFGETVRVFTENVEDDTARIKEVFGAKDFYIEETEPVLEDIFLSRLSRTNESSEELLNMVADSSKAKTGVSVKTEKLTRTFGDFTAVNNISFSVDYGEIFGFLGPNGAGKSTTIKMLCGLLPPSSGYGEVGGFDIRKSPEKIKQNIGYMSQKFSLYEDLKVYENINFYGRIYGLSGKRLDKRRDWALELSGLTDRSKDMTANLAGGWRQRLALACAILHEPPVVFLDEPTSGADPASRRLFWDIINELAGAGVTVFVSTHYMEEAEYCDRLALIFRGDMIAIGSSETMKTDYMDEKILDIKTPLPQNYLNDLSKIKSVNDASLFGSGIHIRTHDAENAEQEIRAYFNTKGKQIAPKMIEPSMEDVFVSLIEKADRG